MSLRHHLGADQEVDLVLRESTDQRLEALAAARIAVESGDGVVGKEGANVSLELFGPDSTRSDALIRAFRTHFGQPHRMVAMVAAKRLLASMVGEGDVTVRAPPDVTADFAYHARRKPTSVQKQDGLLVRFERVVERVEQAVAEMLRAQFHVGVGFPQVDEFDVGHRAFENARRHLEVLELAALRVLIRLERWRRASEDYLRSVEAAADDGHVARIVSRPLLLLEARVVFLVDDDDPDVVERREQG